MIKNETTANRKLPQVWGKDSDINLASCSTSNFTRCSTSWPSLALSLLFSTNITSEGHETPPTKLNFPKHTEREKERASIKPQLAISRHLMKNPTTNPIDWQLLDLPDPARPSNQPNTTRKVVRNSRRVVSLRNSRYSRPIRAERRTTTPVV